MRKLLIGLLLLFPLTAIGANLPPDIKFCRYDSNGDPLSGGKLYTYQAGTTTNQATYTDQDAGTPNANPVVLDSSGCANVWLDPALSYKFVLKDSNDVTLWTVDNVVGLLEADSVSTPAIQDDAVTTAKLADDSVTADILKDSSDTDADRAVTTNHIRDSAITTAKVASDAITPAKVDPGVVTKTGAATLAANEAVVFADASGAAFTVTLPAVASAGKYPRHIIKTDDSFNAVTIDGDGSETVGGELTRVLSTEGDSITIVPSGSGWEIVSRRIPSEWKSYTLTIGAVTSAPTPGSGATSKAFWRRVGDSIEIQYSFVQGNAGTAGSGTYLFPLPPGLTMDTDKLNGTQSTNTFDGIAGPATVNVNGTGSTGMVRAYDETNLILEVLNDGAGEFFVGGGGGSLANAVVRYNFMAKVPIEGWEP